jgi:chromate transport protein ChrA
MLEILAAIIAILAAILPPIIAHWAAQSALGQKEADALTQRSLEEIKRGVAILRAGTDHKTP